MMMFWVLTRCRLMDKYQHFGETHCLRLQDRRWRQNVCPKRWHLATDPHDVKTQNNIVFVLPVLRP
jgi:hypothetical protein